MRAEYVVVYEDGSTSSIWIDSSVLRDVDPYNISEYRSEDIVAIVRAHKCED